jgi:hypothetical protein
MRSTELTSLQNESTLTGNTDADARITIAIERPVSSFTRMESQLTGPGGAGGYLANHHTEINTMKRCFATVPCVVVAIGFATALAYGLNTPVKNEASPFAPFEFRRTAADTPEDAARSLFRGVSTESPKRFVQHLLLGVCDNSIDTLQKFAESLHTTEFVHDGDSFTFYSLRDLRRGINPKKPVRIVGSAPFDTEDKQVATVLHLGMISTYYGEKFVSVDVVGQGYDGLEYQTRIVVTRIDNGWYAMPRCRSAQSFYQIADAMQLTPAIAK